VNPTRSVYADSMICHPALQALPECNEQPTSKHLHAPKYSIQFGF